MSANDNIRKVKRTIDETIENIWSRNFFYKLLRTSDPVDDIAKAINNGNTAHKLDILDVPLYERTLGRHNRRGQYGYYTERTNDETEVFIEKTLHNKKNKNKQINEIEDAWSAQQYINFPDIVIDRQTALNEEKGDAVGRVDLILYYNKNLIFGEVKQIKSSEPLLRAILEVNTYFNVCNQKQLIGDFIAHSNRLKEKEVSSEIRKAIVVFEYKFPTGRRGQKESLYSQLYLEKYRNVQSLMKNLKVYAIKADSLEKGTIEFYQGYSPEDY